jgi:enediyne biosynthesis protein E4
MQQFFGLESERAQIDQTVWAKELLAQKHEQIFIDLWDQLRTNRDPYAVLKKFTFGELVLPEPASPEEGPHEIELIRFSGAEKTWTAEEFRELLKSFEESGYRLEQSEWRHPEFDPGNGSNAFSRIYMTLHAIRPETGERFIFRGDLRVTWSRPADLPGSPAPPENGVETEEISAPTSPGRSNPKGLGAPFPERIEVAGLELLKRQGPPIFQQVISKRVAPNEGTIFIDPLITYDLSGNGLSEIILLCKNLVYWNQGQGQFQAERLVEHFIDGINTGIIADFDGDGIPDLLCANLEVLLFYQGDAEGKFRGEPRRIRFTEEPLLNPFVMTAGDINGDGHLDVWLGQYKLPYLEGQMPTPYYDANDGFHSFLLVNDGQANFTDRTEEAGLGAKRFRRVYSGSFVDLNNNGHLDLVVVSDFAGVDLYFNDGGGNFREVTGSQIANPHSFGMAHSFGDYNRDGQLDFLVIGMNSYVGDRLHGMDLGPSEFPEHQAKRPDMAFGNRLYLAGENGFVETELSAQIAKSGWSWGVTSFDFDNNGSLDVAIVNGHKSRLSAKDYETQFWRHDIYAATSEHNPALDLYFRAVGSKLYGAGQSYGGYEKNRFYINQEGSSFLEAGYLLGVALERDSRNLVSDDLDGDGMMDLILTTYEEWPRPLQELLVYRNSAVSAGNWIGFRLREHGNGFSPVGAKVTLESSGGRQIRQIVTGDSYRSQHANTVHFGLGDLDEVERVEIRWPNGLSTIFESPEINRYHAAGIPLISTMELAPDPEAARD